MNNFEKIKNLDMDELATFLYVNISKKGLKKTKEWLQEEKEEETNESTP